MRRALFLATLALALCLQGETVRADEAPVENPPPASTEDAGAATTPTTDTDASDQPKEETKGESKGITLGSKAPEFSLPDLDGKMVALSDLLERGPVLIDFWALWCKPCLQSLPGTDKLRETYGPRGLSVLAINTDSPRSAAKVKSYVKSNRFGFGVLTDPNGAMQRLYRFYRIPQTFLIASDGTIAFSQLGYSPGTEERLAKEIDKIIPPRQDSKGE